LRCPIERATAVLVASASDNNEICACGAAFAAYAEVNIVFGKPFLDATRFSN
jgi:hypothetical protein